jgi:hypothetical protein
MEKEFVWFVGLCLSMCSSFGDCQDLIRRIYMVLPDVDDVDGPPESSAVDRGLLAEVDELHTPRL